MPAHRFWTMDRNVGRIMAEKELRQVNVARATAPGDGTKEAIDQLVLELGETYKIERPTVIRAGEGARQRMKALSRG